MSPLLPPHTLPPYRRSLGVVRNKHKLDREKIPQHNFKVVATDPGGHACETKVTVNLIDVNDNPPTFMEAIKVGRDQVSLIPLLFVVNSVK